MISQKVRQVAKLYKQIRKTSDVTDVESCFDPARFEHYLKCVKCVGKKNTTGEFDTPSAVLKLSGYVAQCATVARNEALKRGDNQTRDVIENFLCLHKTEFRRVSRSAKNTLLERNFNKVQVLPLFEDIQKFHDYTNTKIKYWTGKTGKDAYIQLVKYNAAKIIMFNRKRSGEVERILLQHFKNGITNPQVEPHLDIIRLFSKFEKALSTKLVRIEIMGKRYRRVAILLTPMMVESLNYMVQLRDKYVHSESKFLFSRPGICETPYQGYKLLYDVASEAKVSDPDCFKSTKLRKHLATMTQMLEIPESDRHLLANFMGHSDAVHKKYYKLPDSILEKSKVAQILIAINSGREEFKGRPLSSITRTDVMLEELLGNDQSDDSFESETEDTPKIIKKQGNCRFSVYLFCVVVN